MATPGLVDAPPLGCAMPNLTVRCCRCRAGAALSEAVEFLPLEPLPLEAGPFRTRSSHPPASKQRETAGVVSIRDSRIAFLNARIGRDSRMTRMTRCDFSDPRIGPFRCGKSENQGNFQKNRQCSDSIKKWPHDPTCKVPFV